eukprot:TRINITY_DN7653_c4_g1_i1.p1 TRINITY_DN7653_c4_g1~~TRINITY_DN7653_c4_g1_i1.p1  ORF type:complete len:169 (-),score=8.25 TRINITY_DN7653_c4_g1_i1:2277-2783(-)
MGDHGPVTPLMHHRLASSTITNLHTLLHETLQQIVQSSLASAFSAIGFSGTFKPSSVWCVHYDASHHMTSSLNHLINLQSMPKNQYIHTANGGWIPIATLVIFLLLLSRCIMLYFLCSSLTTFYLSVTWLIINYQVTFSHDGWLIQNQETGKPIVRRHKNGQLFRVKF